MSRRLKNLITSDLKGSLDEIQDAVVLDCSALSGADIFTFRNLLRETKLTANVVKNTLARRALKELGRETHDDWFNGPTTLVHGDADAITASKLLDDWRKKNKKKVRFKGGLLEGEALSAAEAERLLDMPSPQELKGMVVSVIAGPLQQMVNITSNVLAGVPQVLQAIVDKKSEGE